MTRLGGVEVLARSARETKAFVRPRVAGTAADLLRLLLACCLGEQGLRATAAWAAAVGLADLSNVALLRRLRRSGDWLAFLVGQLLAAATPEASRGRPIRIVDATAIAKAGAAAGKTNRLWRIHSAFDLPGERFGWFELTDEREGERLDRVPVARGEIRLADRGYVQPDRISAVLKAGGDVVIRSGWRSARWLSADETPFDLVAALDGAGEGDLVDRPVWVARKSGAPPPLRMVALRKSEQAAAEARRKVRRAAQRERRRLSRATLVAAGWIVLLTSLKPDALAAQDALAPYRLRWRIELGFKRLKSLVGLQRPPGVTAASARPCVLAHLLAILLLEPLAKEFEDSPHWRQAA